MKKLILLSIILLLGCATEPQNVHGCFDSQACNYNSSATIDNNSCKYSDINDGCCFVSELDCFGICNGQNELDECGICGGTNYVDCMDAIIINSDFNNSQDLDNFSYNMNHFQSLQISDSSLHFTGMDDEIQHKIMYSSDSYLSDFTFISRIKFNDFSNEDVNPNYGIAINNDDILYKLAMTIKEEQYTSDKYRVKYSYYNVSTEEWSGGEFEWFNYELDDYLDFKIILSNGKLYCYVKNILYFEKDINSFQPNKFSIYNQDSHSYSVDNFIIYKP